MTYTCTDIATTSREDRCQIEIDANQLPSDDYTMDGNIGRAVLQYLHFDEESKIAYIFALVSFFFIAKLASVFIFKRRFVKSFQLQPRKDYVRTTHERRNSNSLGDGLLETVIQVQRHEAAYKYN